MTRSEQSRNAVTVGTAMVAGLFIVLIGAIAAQGQTFTVIHKFTGSDGANPYAGLTIDRGGNLYGTTQYGGHLSSTCPGGCGTIFRMAQRGSGWLLSELYEFTAGPEGYPQARVVFGPDGTLYGTASGFGGYGDNGPGAVFNLRPPATVCKSVSCPWTETVLFQFVYGGTGFFPLGDLTFDAAGNIYGTTQYGGLTQYCSGGGCGVAYELTQSGGVWTESILHAFTSGADGAYPNSGVIFDQAGNLYGTAPQDDYQTTDGLVYELSPSSSGWTQNALYYFQAGSDGAYPYAGLIFDSAGNLYGTTRNGPDHGGTVFELTPAEDNWDYDEVYGLPGDGCCGPYGTLVMDATGNLYGATLTAGAYGQGNVFKLTPSDGGWTYTDLHDFTGQSDGGQPYGNLVLDANGNIYGTTYAGGNFECQGDFGCGVVFEITP